MKEFFKNKWPAGFPETVSGTGSKLEHTSNIRDALPTIFSKYNIKSIFDAPCGDRNWIKHVDFSNVEYYGGDIVPDIITDISLPNVFEFDLRTDEPPEVDLWFCRDCLYHLSESDIQAVIDNMLRSNIKYFLITSHKKHHTGDRRNRDINTGDYRCLILSEHDYFGLPEPIAAYDDCFVNLEEEMLLFKVK